MILCAAVMVEITEGDNSRTLIIPCRRHGDGLAIVQEMRNINSDDSRHIQARCQGFIDHQGTFLDRTVAYNHALECGQLSETTRWYKEDHCDTELFSEDLY